MVSTWVQLKTSEDINEKSLFQISTYMPSAPSTNLSLTCSLESRCLNVKHLLVCPLFNLSTNVKPEIAALGRNSNLGIVIETSTDVNLVSTKKQSFEFDVSFNVIETGEIFSHKASNCPTFIQTINNDIVQS